MAGDWLQIDLDLPEKPEVQAISRASAFCPHDGGARPQVSAECVLEVTLGRLMLFWRWVERHASTELVRRADVHTLIALCGGDEHFWRAVESVGWVSFSDEGIVIPGWRKRFSKSAKRRIKDAKRKREQRRGDDEGVRKTSAVRPQNVRDARTKLGPKEEKRRVDSNTLFATFWESYPRRNGRKLGKAKARALFKSLGHEDQPLAAAAAANYAESSDAKRGFAKDPERFLKADYWRDWLEAAEAAPVASRAPTDEDLANWNPVDGGLGTEFE